MKEKRTLFKNLLLLIMLLIGTSFYANSQTQTLFYQDWEDGWISRDWSTDLRNGWVDWYVTTYSYYPYCSSYSGSYYINFDCWNAYIGEYSLLISPSFDLSTPGNSVVKFYIYRGSAYDGYNDKVEIYASTTKDPSDGKLLGTIYSLYYYDPSEGGGDSWYYYEYDIPRSDFKGKTNYIIFKPISDYVNAINLDDVWVDWTPLPPDAGISTLASPKSPFSVGIQNVTATLKNFGELDLTSATIEWWVNGVKQTNFNWTGKLTQNQTSNIVLGTYNFSYPASGPFNPFQIRVRTINPNGQTDGVPANDEINVSVSPILNDVSPTAIAGPPGGFPPGNAALRVKVRNNAPKPLSSVTVQLDIEGFKLNPVTTTGLNVLTGQEVYVNAGTYGFSQTRQFTITATTSNPNGIADEVNTNDTYTGVMGPSLAPGQFTIGGSGANFATLVDAMSYLNAAGVIGDGDVYFILRPGTYTGQMTLDNFPHGNNKFYFQSLTGNPSSVIIQHSPAVASNYVMKIANLNNFYFKDLTFKNTNNNTSIAGTIFNIINCNSINFDNVVLQGVEGAPKTIAYSLLNFSNVPNFTITNSFPTFGSYGLYDVTDVCSRNVSITKNSFQGQSWFGIYMSNGCIARQNNTIISDNSFLSANNTRPTGGISSINAVSTITNNVFSALNGTTWTDAAIYVQNHWQNTDLITVNGNKINNCSNVSGIYMSSVYGGEIKNNTINISGNGSSAIGIRFEGNGSGGDNKIYIQNNTVNMVYGYGVFVTSAYAHVLYNYIYCNSTYQSGLGAFFAEFMSGYLGANMIISNNADGVILNDPSGIEVYYNSVNTMTNNNAAFFIFQGSGGGEENKTKKNGKESTQDKIENGALVMRNLFINSGGGNAINGFSSVLVSDQNDWFTSGKNLHPMYATLSDWQKATGQDLHSASANVIFKSPTDLHLTQINDFIVSDYPLFEDSDPHHMMFEHHDWDGEPRLNAYYYGVDHVQPVVSIYQQPESQIVCSNGSVRPTFSVLASVSFGATPRYQWQKDGVDLPGKNTAQFNIELADLTYDKSGAYRCVISSAGGAEPVTSDEVLLYVLTPPEITRNPESVIGEQGGTAMFEVKAHMYNFGAPVERLQYQWYAGDINNPLEDDNHIAGSKSSILSITKIRPQDFRNDYFVVVTDQCGTATSDFCGILVPPDVNITGQPQDASICEGQNANFGVTAEIIGGGKVLSYEWWKDGVKLEDNANISGAMTANLTIATIGTGDAGKYKCKVTVMPGAVSKETNEAELVVKLKPTITTQPEATVDVQTGRNFSLTVAADGTAPLYYQWYKDDQELAGETNPAYSVPSATLSDAGTYKCKVSNDCGEIFTNNTVVNVTMENSTDVPELSYNGFTLYTNTPNPFTEQTTITFAVPRSSEVRLAVNDIFGREVAVLFNGTATGRTDIRFDASKLASGIYYYTMSTNGFNGTKQMVIVK